MTKEKTEVITVKKNTKKILVIKKLPKGNSAIKYGFTSSGSRMKAELITREKADILIEKILRNQAASGVQIIGDVTAHSLMQELFASGKVTL